MKWVNKAMETSAEILRGWSLVCGSRVLFYFNLHTPIVLFLNSVHIIFYIQFCNQILKDISSSKSLSKILWQLLEETSKLPVKVNNKNLNDNFQKQPSRSALWKRCSENMHHICRRAASLQENNRVEVWF